jgi:plastocyanin
VLLLGLLGCSNEQPAPTADASQPNPAPQVVGSLEGMVRYAGVVPPPRKITTTEGSVIEHSDLVVEPKTRGLRNVVAILENAPEQAKIQKAQPVIVDQQEMTFAPRVVAVQHGQAIRFENSDRCNHSVLASSTLEANQFNVFVAPNQPHEHVFVAQKPPVQIGCSLHGWMRAWVYVVPHPWFAVSDAQGRFRISVIPAGKYSLWLRHPDTGLQKRLDVEIVSGQAAVVNLAWEAVPK